MRKGASKRSIRQAVGLVMGVLLLAGTSNAADPAKKPAPKLRSEIRDGAHIWGADALKEARDQLLELERLYKRPVIIETAETVREGSIDDALKGLAKTAGDDAIVILVVKKEMRIESRVPSFVSDHSGGFISANILRANLIPYLYGRDPARGLKVISVLLQKGLANVSLAEDFERLKRDSEQLAAEIARTEQAEASEKRAVDDQEPLVLRNQVHLTLAGARVILAAAEAKAAEMKLKVNIAIVDDGGHMISFARMDGARPASGYTATTKAVTAATFRQATGPLPPGTTIPDVLLNVGLQNAALASGGKITTLLGGVPVIVDGQVIGGVGVGGGTGEQDATIARAGIDALLKQLDAPALR